MRSLSRFASVVLSAGVSAALALTLAAGCGPQDDEFSLDSLPEATEDEKADSTGKYAWVRPSAFPITCIRQPCASHQVREVNGTNTQLVYLYDWRALKLTTTQTDDADAKAPSMLLYGRYTPVKVLGETMTVFQVTRALAPASTKTADRFGVDRYYSVAASGTVCVKEPCPTLAGQALGVRAGSPDMWNRADLRRLQLSTTAEDALVAELRSGKAYLAVTGVTAQVADVSQAFRPFTAAALR